MGSPSDAIGRYLSLVLHRYERLDYCGMACMVQTSVQTHMMVVVMMGVVVQAGTGGWAGSVQSLPIPHITQRLSDS